MLHCDYNPLATWDIMPSGFLRVSGTIARVGWLRYQNADGSTRWEEVPPSTLFDTEHLASIGGSPLTLEHPPDKVTPQNYKQFAIGSTGTKIIANHDDGLVDIVTIICEQEAIDSVLSGETRQLSMGYECEVSPRQDGKFTQVKRLCNHNAIVKYARAGDVASLHFDGWKQVGFDEKSKKTIIDIKPRSKSEWRIIRVMA